MHGFTVPNYSPPKASPGPPNDHSLIFLFEEKKEETKEEDFLAAFSDTTRKPPKPYVWLLLRQSGRVYCPLPNHHSINLMFRNLC